MANPLFTATFNIKSDNYANFIADLRKRLGNPAHFSHNRPVLPPQQEPPKRWFHILLKTETQEITLTTRADNLYLYGFRSKDAKGVQTWWEFGKNTPGARHLIDNSTFLGFDRDYRELVGDTDNLTAVNLGPEQMTKAVNTLATRTAADLKLGAAQQKAKDSLIVLVLMIHESTRFTSVSKYAADLIHPKAAKKSGTITSEMKKQINGWKDLSTALLKSDTHPKEKFSPFPEMGVNTVEEAAAAIGILLFVEVKSGMTESTALKLLGAGSSSK